MKAEIKIFVSMFLVVFISAFLGVFLLMPLYYGHPIFDFARIGNQIVPLFVFFLFLSCLFASLSVVSYRAHRIKLVRIEGVIFLFTSCIVFITIVAVILAFIPTYWGHAVVDFGRLETWATTILILFFFCVSLIIAGIPVVIYEVYRVTSRQTGTGTFLRVRRQ